MIGPKTNLPNAKILGDTSLCLLIHPTITSKEIRKTCQALAKVGQMASL